VIDRVLVFVDRADGEPAEVGEAFFTAKGGRLVSTTFRYDTGWLARRGSFPLDPDLPLVSGTLNVAGLPGALQDCSPDRWGRNLIAKQHRALAREQGRRAATLTEQDYLVGVSDSTRQGALRVKAAEDGPFLGTGASVPPLLQLPRLLRAADSVGRSDDLPAIKELLAAGSGSLGGARPKASVMDGDRLMIAKFPHADDEWDVMAWERTALDLAASAGIAVPPARLTEADGRSVLLVERFDRDDDGTRVAFMSAMTMLGARDGDVHDYLEIADAIPEHSAAARDDLRQLWRRALFSVLINNVDDHLRNHAFLRSGSGWVLSPVFDVNPNPDPGTSRQTTIGGAAGREQELDALLEYAAVFDLTPVQARAALEEVSAAVAGWRDVAAGHGVAEQEIDRFRDAFWVR
jgi:serine/threonine-protein kinase HipA